MKKTLVAWMRWGQGRLSAWLRTGLRLAYLPGKSPKRPLPGPFYDLTVVGLFVALGLGYLAL